MSLCKALHFGRNKAYKHHLPPGIQQNSFPTFVVITIHFSGYRVQNTYLSTYSFCAILILYLIIEKRIILKANESNYVIIYVKKGFCPKCRQTLNLLDRLNVKVVKKVVEPDDEITIGLLKQNGAQQFPYVMVVDGAGELLDSWSDFKPEKVKEWFE